MDCNMPGFPDPRQLPDLAQTHVHYVGDAIQPSHPLLSPSLPALNLSEHQGLFKWVSSLHQVAKVLELQHQSFQWIFRIDFQLVSVIYKSCIIWALFQLQAPFLAPLRLSALAAALGSPLCLNTSAISLSESLHLFSFSYSDNSLDILSFYLCLLFYFYSLNLPPESVLPSFHKLQ